MEGEGERREAINLIFFLGRIEKDKTMRKPNGASKRREREREGGVEVKREAESECGHMQ